MWAGVVWATYTLPWASEDAAELLARLGPAVEDRAEGRQLGHLAAERGGRGLAARVRVDLRVEDEDLDVGAGGDHPRQGLEADVVHRPVAADDPQPAIGMARLVPAATDAEGHGRGILEE